MRSNVEKLKSYRSFRVPVEDTDKIGFKVYGQDDKGQKEELSATLLVNVSLTGVGFYTGKEIEQDETIDVQLTFKGVRFLIPGTIIRSEIVYNAYGECEKYFYGIQFLESDQELTKKFLAKFISSFSAKRLKNHLIKLLTNEGKLNGHDDIEKIELVLSLFMDMSKFDEVDGFLELLFLETARLSDASRTNLFLLNKSKTEMVLFDWKTNSLSKDSFAFNGSLVEKVFHKRKIINHRVNRFDDHDSFYNLLLAHYDMETGSVLLAPVFDRRNNIIGMIEFANKQGDDFFKEEDELYIQLLSKVVSSVFDAQDCKTSTNIKEKIRVPRKFDLIGNSHYANEMRAFAKHSATTDKNVLLMGEKGTGKSLLAHIIHIESNAGSMACGKLNCNISDTEELLQTLNGDNEHVGKLELYSGGTIILENLEKLNLQNQRILLDALKAREDIRVISLAHIDLESLCAEDLFLKELHQYLEEVVYDVPALLDRKDDILELADFYLQKSCKEKGLLPKVLSVEVSEKLVNYTWPGNILELKTAMERIVMYYPNLHVVKEISSEIIPVFNTFGAQENAYREILSSVCLEDYGISSKELLSLVKAQYVVNEITLADNEDISTCLEKLQLNIEEYNNIITEAKYILEKHSFGQFEDIKDAA
jgi:DNA-binding NtrC family response regulator